MACSSTLFSGRGTFRRSEVLSLSGLHFDIPATRLSSCLFLNVVFLEYTPPGTLIGVFRISTFADRELNDAVLFASLFLLSVWAGIHFVMGFFSPPLPRESLVSFGVKVSKSRAGSAFSWCWFVFSVRFFFSIGLFFSR